MALVGALLSVVSVELKAKAPASFNDGVSNCARLQTLTNNHLTIASATAVAAEMLKNLGQTLRAPAFCRVVGSGHSTAKSEIGFELWLPADWNGRYAQLGNGGFAGNIDLPSLAGEIGHGNAVAMTDTGHRANQFGASSLTPITPLRRFAKHGGKLIMYFGWSDSLLSPRAGLAYYQSSAWRMGGVHASRQFFRLFLVPGMQHCQGGVGPTSFGQSIAAPASNPDRTHDVRVALEFWVEQGIPPDALLAADGESPHLTARALRPFPDQPGPVLLGRLSPKHP